MPVFTLLSAILAKFKAHRTKGRSIRRRSLAFAVIIICVACWHSASGLAETKEPPTYRIGPGDALKITVWRDPELSTSVTVRPDGRITVPLVEDVPAAGKTPAELAETIKQGLSQYRRDVLVTVVVVSGLGDLSQQIRIVGQAVTPKALPYQSGMTLLDAIIAAGGLSPEADGNGAVIERKEDGSSRQIPVRIADLVRDGDPTANVALLPGDVIVIPEGFLEGEWHVSYRATATETFSDNIDQDPKGHRNAALITRAGPGISVSGSSARVQGAFSGDLFGVYQFGGEDEGFSLDPAISGTSTTELVPNHVFLDASANIRRRLLDARDNTSGSGASTSNRDLVAAFSASPYLVHQLGQFADAEWRYRVTPVLVDASGHSDSLNQEASVTLDSGPDFSTVAWTFSNIGRLEERSQESDIKSANSDLALSYAVWDGFAVLAGIGYEYRSGDEDESDNFQGVTWHGGFRYEPNPDFNLQATYGRRDNDNNLNASLNYNIGPKTTLTAAYAEALETGQGRAESSTRQLSIDPDTGEIVSVADEPFSFQDETTRTRTLRLGAVYADGRDTITLSGLRGTSDGGEDGDEKFYNAAITWSRILSEEFNFSTLAAYEHSDFTDDNRTDDTYLVNLRLGYQLSGRAQTFVSYSFQAQDSTQEDEDFIENAITVGITASY